MSAGVTSIEASAFGACPLLVSATFQGLSAPTFGTSVFTLYTNGVTIYYPAGGTGYDSLGYPAVPFQDTTPPVAPVILSPADGSTISMNLPLFTGTAEAASTVTVFLDGISAGTAAASTEGNWSFMPATALTAGTHPVKATATDSAGNVSADSNVRTFTVNTAPVRKSGVEPAATANVTANIAYTLDLLTIFEDEDGDALTYKVSVNGGAEQTAAASYSYTLTATGTVMLVFKANDGKTDSADTYTVTLTVNAALPTDKTLVSITVPTDITGVASGTEKTASALGLPSTVTLVTDDGNVQAEVTWDVASSSYDPSVATEQTFDVDGTVTLPSGVVNTDSVSLDVSISVTVNAASITVTSVTVKTEPIKTTYTSGNSLDLDGLVITLHKSDSSTEDIAFADFSGKGITTDPINGSELSAGNTTVIITYTADNKSASQRIEVDSAPESDAIINPKSVNYNLNTPDDVVTTITWNSAEKVTDVGCDTTSLITPDAYVVNGDELTVKSSYFDTLKISAGDEVKFHISFDKGDFAILTANIVDSYHSSAFNFSNLIAGEEEAIVEHSPINRFAMLKGGFCITAKDNSSLDDILSTTTLNGIPVLSFKNSPTGAFIWPAAQISEQGKTLSLVQGRLDNWSESDTLTASKFIRHQEGSDIIGYTGDVVDFLDCNLSCNVMQLYVNAENIVYPIIVSISASDNDSELVWDESWPKNNEALTTILQNELGTTDNYTFYIAPSFRKKGSSHTNLLYLPITATAGEGGSITESGEKIFRPGAIDQTYTVTANAGYTISYILVDGTPVPNSFNCGEIAAFTFDAIYGPRTINAIFKKVEGNFTH